eukprot:TRINITY_DN22778_c0_g1_i1.p1 TRINITY_DN22778_c0_g1~~TRINITY_DN22778_c0_g1_i1.p1  ORF type:complete len:141 (+),score=10.45 TRINITY_DN22778_c0_g1_i1:1096-1518(+)
MSIVDFFVEAVLVEPYLFICFQTIVVLLDLRKKPSLFPLLFRCNHLNRADLNWLEFMRLVILDPLSTASRFLSNNVFQTEFGQTMDQIEPNCLHLCLQKSTSKGDQQNFLLQVKTISDHGKIFEISKTSIAWDRDLGDTT